MNRLAENTYRIRHNLVLSKTYPFGLEKKETVYVPRDAKLLAWAIFLMLFIENGTLGFLPPQLYFVYRNMRISDFLMYGLIIYSLLNIGEISDLQKCKALLVPKLLLGYYLVQFIASVLIYQQNIIEYFFRMKNLWASFLIFPYLLLLKRGGLEYMIKIFFPFAVISNILYILTALTGVALLPDIAIVKVVMPGGLEIYRVWGGTFYGDMFLLGFIFLMITKRFRLRYLTLTIFFMIPQILTFGRGSWVFIVLCITLILLWNTMRKREMKVVARQIVLGAVIGITLIFSFKQFIPESELYTEALQTRVVQGSEDVQFKEGTYGTRLENVSVLVDLWLNSNILFGVGMSPFWVIKPETTQEMLYMWGLSDLTWPGVLAVYGLIGFLLAASFQITFIFLTLKILKNSKDNSLLLFFILLFLTSLLNVLINYTFALLSTGIYGFGFLISFYVAVTVYKYDSFTEKSN